MKASPMPTDERLRTDDEIMMTFRTDGNHRYSWIRTNDRCSLAGRAYAPSGEPQPLDAGAQHFRASSRPFDLNGETKSVRTKHSSAIIVR